MILGKAFIQHNAIETRIDYETVDMKLEERTKSLFLLKHAIENVKNE